MKGDRGRCLEMRLAERPGHDVKWPIVVDVDDGIENIVGLLFLLGVDVIKESLMGLIGTNIILLLIEVAFYREGGSWKMFGDEASRKARP